MNPPTLRRWRFVALFTALMAPGFGPALAEPFLTGTPPAERHRLEALREGFTAAGGFQRVDAAALTEALSSALADSDSVFPAHARLDPLTKAALTMETREPAAPFARYRLRYGLAMVVGSPAGKRISVSLIEVQRFNLGTRRHRTLIREHGEKAGDVTAFAPGPHLAYRLITRPLMGHHAAIDAVARRVIPDAEARRMQCLGHPCLSSAATNGTRRAWGSLRPVDFEPRRTPPVAAVVEALLRLHRGAPEAQEDPRWREFEPREAVPPGEPFVEIVVETGFQQEPALDAVLRDRDLMDHSVHTIWRRLLHLPAGAESYHGLDVVYRRGPSEDGHPPRH
ncbi:hypothetical protein [Arhodomonas sp. SL1]|uniref:hypothetical protein n=1 Tax=Arhodomonas sp. SL1 TaxID=3425691 RepID=UPI003F881137